MRYFGGYASSSGFFHSCDLTNNINSGLIVFPEILLCAKLDCMSSRPSIICLTSVGHDIQFHLWDKKTIRESLVLHQTWCLSTGIRKLFGFFQSFQTQIDLADLWWQLAIQVCRDCVTAQMDHIAHMQAPPRLVSSLRIYCWVSLPGCPLQYTCIMNFPISIFVLAFMLLFSSYPLSSSHP